MEDKFVKSKNKQQVYAYVKDCKSHMQSFSYPCKEKISTAEEQIFC